MWIFHKIERCRFCGCWLRSIGEHDQGMCYVCKRAYKAGVADADREPSKEYKTLDSRFALLLKRVAVLEKAVNMIDDKKYKIAHDTIRNGGEDEI